MRPDFLEALRRLGYTDLANLMSKFWNDAYEAGFFVEPTLTIKPDVVGVSLKMKPVEEAGLPLFDGGNGSVAETVETRMRANPQA